MQDCFVNFLSAIFNYSNLMIEIYKKKSFGFFLSSNNVGGTIGASLGSLGGGGVSGGSSSTSVAADAETSAKVVYRASNDGSSNIA